MDRIVYELNQFTRGWWIYYRLATTRSMFKSLNGWMIRRLRAILWKQWKNPRTRVRNLKKHGIYHSHAMKCGNARKPEAKLSKPACKAGENEVNGKGCWRMSRVKWIIIAMPNNYFIQKYGLFLPGS